MNWNSLASNPWAITIGGGVVVVFVGWLGRKLFRNHDKLPSDATTSIQQNASPAVTQNFQPVIQVSPTVLVDKRQGPDALSASTVRELWKLIAALRTAFWALPKAGGVIGPSDTESRRKASREFTRLYDETAKFLNEEIISLPQAIADDTSALLKIAFDEVVQAAHWPDPFDDTVSTALGERGWTDFLDGRSRNLKNFNIGAEELQVKLRDFLAGKPVTASATPVPNGSLVDTASGDKHTRNIHRTEKRLEELLATCRNNVAVEFFRQRSNMPTNSNKNALTYRYRRAGKIHWYVWPVPTGAAVLQIDRFADDEATWRKGLSNPNMKPQTYVGKANLRFDLTEKSDFDFFAQIVEKDSEPSLLWMRPEPELKRHSEVDL